MRRKFDTFAHIAGNKNRKNENFFNSFPAGRLRPRLRLKMQFFSKRLRT